MKKKPMNVKKLERKLREKEQMYQERLKAWEQRERKMAREYEKEKEKEDERRAEETREARRLREFLEDYDDERDDPKFYKGSALQRRLKEREEEMERDNRDRQREKEEMEEIKRKLRNNALPNFQTEIMRLDRERDMHLIPCLRRTPDKNHHEMPIPSPEKSPPIENPQFITIAPLSNDEDEEVEEENHIDIPPPIEEPTAPDSDNDSDSSSSSSSEDNDPPEPIVSDSERRNSLPTESISNLSFPTSPPNMEQSNSNSYASLGSPEPPVNVISVAPISSPPLESPIENNSHNTHNHSSPPHKHLSLSGSKRKKYTVEEVFNQDDDEPERQKRPKLTPLNQNSSPKKASNKMVPPVILLPSTKPVTAEDKRKLIKTLIEKIPTGKEELFAYPLDWTMVDPTLMERRIKPWVNKKIVEYIGEEEPSLTDFICSKVMANSMPQTILNDVAMVLDEEAETFVVKMWRLLIYGTEAKKAGLVK